MSTYLAKHFVRTENGTYTPGEYFDHEFDAETLKRLIELGAVQPCGAERAQQPAEIEPEEPWEADEPEDEPETDAEMPEMIPEIDVMDGIGEAAPEPKKRGRAKK